MCFLKRERESVCVFFFDIGIPTTRKLKNIERIVLQKLGVIGYMGAYFTFCHQEMQISFGKVQFDHFLHTRNIFIRRPPGGGVFQMTSKAAERRRSGRQV